MRQAVRVPITEKQYQELRNLLSLMYNSTMLLQGQYPEVTAFMANATEQLLDDPGNLIEVAKKHYEDDETNIDDDAALSRADEGVWVGAWVWVSNEIAGIPDEENDDGEAQADTAGEAAGQA